MSVDYKYMSVDYKYMSVDYKYMSVITVVYKLHLVHKHRAE